MSLDRCYDFLARVRHGVIVLFVQIDTVYGQKTQIYPILNKGIAPLRTNSQERVNLHEKYDYPKDIIL